MRMVGRIHETVDEREKAIAEALGDPKDLKKGARQAWAVSCEDGILIATINNPSMPFKIRKILSGSIAFVGVGDPNDFRRLYRPASASLEMGRVARSEDDQIMFEQAVDMLSTEIYQKLRDLFSADYYVCEIILVRLSRDKNEDKIYRIDFKGLPKSSCSWVFIPSITQEKQLSGGRITTMREVFRDQLVPKLQEQWSEGAIYEVVALSRKSLESGKEIYHRLSQEEIQNWLCA